MIVSAGIISIFRPALLLYLIASLQVISYFPVISAYNSTLQLTRIGTINVFVQDYLVFILGILLLSYAVYIFIYDKKLFLSILKSPITQIVFILYLWELFIGVLSYQKGFALQNILRRLSVESLMFISIFIPMIKNIQYIKDRFYKYIVFLSIVLVILAFVRYAITNDIEFTSSGTIRTILGNSFVIFLYSMTYALFYNNLIKENIFLKIAFLVILLFGINFTGHRSGYLVFLFVIGLWMMKGHYFSKEFVWIPIWGTSILLIMVFIIPIYASRSNIGNANQNLLNDISIRYLDTFDMENSTTIERLSKWQYSIDTAMTAPLLGLARFPYFSASEGEDFNANLEAFSEVNRPLHNLFAHRLLHEGFLGLSLLILLFIIAIKKIKNISFYDANYAEFLNAYILSFILFSFFNTSFDSADAKAYFFIALGFVNLEIVMNRNYRI